MPGMLLSSTQHPGGWEIIPWARQKMEFPSCGEGQDFSCFNHEPGQQVKTFFFSMNQNILKIFPFSLIRTLSHDIVLLANSFK